ncbi:MAG TPA: hypothetical protein VJ248_07880, partial [Candidatus Udaeobacter sp.]|nr:hypothetical protein [Candidatus Udaeobacter sp.]
TSQKRKPKFPTVRSTVGQDFDAKLRNSAQRTAKTKFQITNQLLYQLSYAGKMRRTLAHAAAWNKLRTLEA